MELKLQAEGYMSKTATAHRFRTIAYLTKEKISEETENLQIEERKNLARNEKEREREIAIG